MKQISFEDLNTSKCPDGLIPAIIQDATTLKVLMLGYMNAEALSKSLDEGRVTFYSRTRRCLWTKGETSGNFLYIKDIRMDCDADTLLIKAEPAGPVCHRGTTSCFDTPDEEGFIRKLGKIIKKRREQMPRGSYTTKLFIKGPCEIAKKVGEESTECIIEAIGGHRDRFIYEASDVIYHLLVLMESMDVSISDIEHELSLRHR